MKNLQLIIGLFCMLVFLPACNDDNDNNITDLTIALPAINNLETNQWVLSEPAADENPFLFRMTWSKARLFNSAKEPVFSDNIVYELQADLFDNNFSQPVTITSTNKLFADIHTLNLNNLVLGMVEEGSEETQTLSFRIKAIANGTDSVYSELLLLAVTPYIHKEVQPQPETPPYVYIIGDMNGWNPSNTDFILFRNNNDISSGEYTYTGNFGAGTWLKFCGEEYLGGYEKMYCAGENGVLEFGDKGAFLIAGYKTVTIDIIKMTWKIEDYDAAAAKDYATLGPIGGFCGWDNEPPMTKSTFDSHQWHLTYEFTTSTACKFRADKDWSKNWGTAEIEIPFGKAVFDGPGATINEPGVYDIYFNDLTGHQVIKKKD